jgi:hypothetical protein
MAVKIDTTAYNIDGLATAYAGTEDERAAKPGNPATPGDLAHARGRLVLAADGRTVEFEPLDGDELAAVIAADS